jgi:lipopolysaccharide transport system ATP-binding protein
MSYAITAQGLGKRFDIQTGGERHDTLLDTLSSWMKPGRPRLKRRATEEFWALRELDFTIESGTSVGLIGRNGAGKSTLLKILSKIIEPSTGEARLKGRVASLLEVGTGFHHDLSGRENIFLNGAILGMKRRETARCFDRIVDYAGVERFIDVPVKRYSSGMYMRLAFAVAAFLESEILIVDEVLAVGDATFQNKCLATMNNAAAGGRTVLFVSHNMSAVTSLTQRSLVLDQGRIVFDGPSNDAARHYMGTRHTDASQSRRPIAEIACNEHWRRDDQLFIAEMGLAQGQSEQIHWDGDVEFEVMVRSTQPQEKLRLAYCVNDHMGRPVLTGLSKNFSMAAGDRLLRLGLHELKLVPGDYDFSLALGTGQIGDFRLERDSFVGFGKLTVLDQLESGQEFGDWPTRWASLIHASSSLREIGLNTSLET